MGRWRSSRTAGTVHQRGETARTSGGRGAVAWAGGRATCDELEMRHRNNKVSDTTDLELPSLRLISFSEDA